MRWLALIILLAGLANAQQTVTANQGLPGTAGAWHFTCDSGCGGASSFLDNAGFTPNVTPINLTGGWYSTTPSNCSDGSACAPQLTLDRKLLVQAFQGTNPFVISGTVTATQATGTNLHTVVDSGAVNATLATETTKVIGTVNIASGQTVGLAAGAAVIGHVIADSGSTTAVTGNVTVVQGTGTNLHTVCDSGCAGGSLTNNNAAPTNNNGGVLPAVANASSPSWTEGNQVLQSVDLHGNQRIQPGASLGSLTPITSVNGTLNATFSVVTGTGVPAVLVQLDQTTTITAGAIRFLVSYDGTNYVNVCPTCAVDPTYLTPIQLPYTLQANTNKAFLILMNGAQALQLKTTTAVTGTGAITPQYSLQPQATRQVVVGSDYGRGPSGTGVALPSTQTIRTDSMGTVAHYDAFAGPQASIIQKGSAVSTGSVTSVAVTLSNPVGENDSLVVVWGVGDSGNRVSVSVGQNQCSQTTVLPVAYDAFGFSPHLGIAYCPVVPLDLTSTTVTVNDATSTSMAMEVYELPGAIVFDGAGDNQNNGASATSRTTDTIVSTGFNDYAFFAVGVGTAAQTITLTTSGYANDSGQLNVAGTPSGLFSFASGSSLLSNVNSTAPNATIPSGEPLSVIAATFRVSGPATVNAKSADGDIVTLGAKADAKSTATDTTSVSIMSVLKEISALEQVPAALPANQSVNVAQVAGGTTATAATGVQKVGMVGNAAAAFDAANNATLPANALAVGFETATQTTTQPTASSAGNMRYGLARTDGALYVAPHGPVIWSCGLNGIAATLTQCQAAPSAGLRLYITDVISQSNTSTAGLFTLRFGTGSNCGTGTGNLIFGSASALMASPANTAPVNHFHLTVPIAVTAANAVCVLGVATNTTDIEINGYTAP